MPVTFVFLTWNLLANRVPLLTPAAFGSQRAQGGVLALNAAVTADGRDVRAAGIAGSPSQKKTKEMKRGESLRGARRCVSGRKQELRNNLCQAPSTKTGFFPSYYHENRAGFKV